MGVGRARVTAGGNERGANTSGKEDDDVLVRSASRAPASIRQTTVECVRVGPPVPSPCTRVPKKCRTTVVTSSRRRRRARRRWSAAAD